MFVFTTENPSKWRSVSVSCPSSRLGLAGDVMPRVVGRAGGGLRGEPSITRSRIGRSLPVRHVVRKPRHYRAGLGELAGGPILDFWMHERFRKLFETDGARSAKKVVRPAEGDCPARDGFAALNSS